jgi:hypothetical protein
MAALLPEIWAQVCLLVRITLLIYGGSGSTDTFQLEKRDLSALGRTARYYHDIATPFLYRSLCIQFWGPESLREAVHEILRENSAGSLFLQHARRLDLVCLKPPWPETATGKQLWELKDWGMEYVHWEHPAAMGNALLEPQLRSSTCVAGLGFPIEELGAYLQRSGKQSRNSFIV